MKGLHNGGNPSVYVREFTFQFDIYKNKNYVLLNSSSYQTRFTQRFIAISGYNNNNLIDIIPISNGFIYFEATFISFYIKNKKATVNDSENGVLLQAL